MAIALAVVPGCEPRSVNRSPSPDQDPERYARAQEDDRRAVAEAKAAEARFFRQLGNPPEAIASSDSDPITP